MSDMRNLLNLVNELSEEENLYEVHDQFDLELDEQTLVEAGIVDLLEDGILIECDEVAVSLLETKDLLDEEELDENGLQRYTGIKKYGKKGFEALQKAGREGASEEEKGKIKDQYLKKEKTNEEEMDEAKYHGKEVPLGKKLPGDVKKSKVYVRKPNGKIVKVNFGDKNMRIKKSNPARRKSFRARHNCKNPGPRWKARYWSCRSW
jgi:hypothetical protein